MKHGPRRIGLALSGGNALGAYAAGAYEALHNAGVRPDVVCGASIGAVTGAIIAGNPPDRVIGNLHAFWQQAASGSAVGFVPPTGRPRDIYNKMHAMQTVMAGRPGMFTPRPSGFISMLPGTPPDVGLFDPRPLVPTLERLIDFDYLNAGHLPLVIAAVDLEAGDAVYFDTRRQAIGPEHLLASTAFIPGFPPVEIDGRCLGDPGMFCNLPLDPLLKSPPHETGAKAIEFSHASIGERWKTGRDDMTTALDALRAGRATRREPGYTFYDCRREG